MQVASSRQQPLPRNESFHELRARWASAVPEHTSSIPEGSDFLEVDVVRPGQTIRKLTRVRLESGMVLQGPIGAIERHNVYIYKLPMQIGASPVLELKEVRVVFRYGRISISGWIDEAGRDENRVVLMLGPPLAERNTESWLARLRNWF